MYIFSYKYSFSKIKLIKTEKKFFLSDALLSFLMQISSFKISMNISSLLKSCKWRRKWN